MNKSSNLDALFERIALEHLHIETLQTQHRDRYDFHEVAVWSVKAALQAAYQAGAASVATPRALPSKAKGKP